MTPIIAQGFLGIEHFNPPWDVFFLPLFNLLIFLYELPLVDFAVAIILFTIIIRTALAPLFVRQIRSQKEMQRMQPLVKEVQRKHKGNRQKVYEETQALYREHGVNPAAGCLPVVLQLPILFALYQALIRASGVVTGFTVNAGNQAAFDQLQAAGLIEAGDEDRRIHRPDLWTLQPAGIQPAAAVPPAELPADQSGQAERGGRHRDRVRP